MPSQAPFPGGEPVAPRCGFLPPRYPVHRLPEAVPHAWKTVPSVALLTDPYGEVPSRRDVEIRLAWEPEALHLRAGVLDAAAVQRPERAPDDPDFWRQDHIELRLLRPREDGADEQLQFILTPHAVSDSLGLWREEGALTHSGGTEGDAWWVHLRLPFDRLGLGPPAAGRVLRGLLAHTRWADGWADFHAISAAELGFSQRQRFAELCLCEAATETVVLQRLGLESFELQAGRNRAAVTLRNNAREPRPGRLLLLRETGPDGHGQVETVERTFAPGETTLHLSLWLDRPRYTRHRFVYEDAAGCRELGRVTLRAGVPRVPTGHLSLRHPYLLFTGEEIDRLRRKAGNPAFAPWVEALSVTPEDRQPPVLAELQATPDYRLQTGDVGWFRFCKENLLTALEGGPLEGRRAPLARLVRLLPEEAVAAARRVKASVAGDAEAIETVRRGVNEVLAGTEFYDPHAFAAVPVPAEARALLDEGLATLPPEKRVRCNRILLQCATPFVPAYRLKEVGRIKSLLAKWLLHGDDKLLAAANELMLLLARDLILKPHVDLHEGGAMVGLALAYDAWHPRLDETERGAWLAVMGRFLEAYLQTARSRHWNCTAIPNANAVCNGGGGLLGLALLREHPDAVEAVQYARKFLPTYINYSYGPDGGCTEGMQYWDYGGAAYLRFAVALERALGTDDGLLAHPHLERWGNNLRLSLCNDGGLHGMNDTIPVPMNTLAACFLAGRFGDELALWWSTRGEAIARAWRQAGREVPYRGDPLFCLLFRPDLPEPAAQPPLPTTLALRDIEYGVLRSGPAYDAPLVAGLKGNRPPYTHHQQPDTGAFFLHVRGERLLIDPGYYKPRPQDHSLPILDGLPGGTSDRWEGALVEHGERGALRWLVCDATGAYPGAAARVLRHLVMVGEEGVVLLDDIEARPDAAGEVRTRFQGGAPAEAAADGRSVRIGNERAAVRLQLLTRPELTLRVEEERDLHDTHWGYHFSACRWFPVAGTYRADGEAPLVTAILDASAGDPGAAAAARDGRALHVTLPSGRGVTFLRHNGRWALELPPADR